MSNRGLNVLLLGALLASCVLIVGSVELFSTSIYSDGFAMRARFYNRRILLQTPAKKAANCEGGGDEHKREILRVAAKALGAQICDGPVRSKRDTDVKELPMMLRAIYEALPKFGGPKARESLASLVHQLNKDEVQSKRALDDKLVAIYTKLMEFVDREPKLGRQLELVVLPEWGHVYDLKHMINSIQRPRMAATLEPDGLMPALRRALQKEAKEEAVSKFLDSVEEIIAGSTDHSRAKLPKIYLAMRTVISERPELREKLLSANINGFGSVHTFYDTTAMVGRDLLVKSHYLHVQFWRVREIQRNTRPDLPTLTQALQKTVANSNDAGEKKFIAGLVNVLNSRPNTKVDDWIERIHIAIQRALSPGGAFSNGGGFGAHQKLVEELLVYVPFGELGNFFDMFYARYYVS